MKTNILSLCVALAAGIGLTACGDDTWNKGTESLSKGSLSLASLSVDVDAVETPASRADISTDDFIVQVVDRTTGATRETWTYSAMPEVFSFAPGDYTVNVKSHKVQPAEWSAPYYVGSADFSIEAGKITEIGTVVCKFSNIKVTIDYTPELVKLCDNNIKVRVVANDHGALEYTPSETRSGYFEAIEGSTTLVAELTATSNGEAVSSIKTYTDVKAGKHYKITFTVKGPTTTPPDETGTIAPTGINVDATIEQEDLGGSADHGQGNQSGSTQRPGDEEWPDTPTPPGPDQPGPDDPGQEEAPISFLYNKVPVTGTTVTDGIVDGQDYIITIDAKKGIKNLNVKITSENANFIASAGEMLPLEFDLATVTGDTAESLESLGLPVGEDVVGETSLPFDISGLVPLLKAFKGTHNFEVTVTDAEGNSKAMTLTIKS